MAKRAKITNLPDVSKQNYELIKYGVKVYPIHFRGKWWIEINNIEKTSCELIIQEIDKKGFFNLKNNNVQIK